MVYSKACVPKASENQDIKQSMWVSALRVKWLKQSWEVEGKREGKRGGQADYRQRYLIVLEIRKIVFSF